MVCDGERRIAFIVTELLGDGTCYWHLNAVAPDAQGQGYVRRAWLTMLTQALSRGAQRVQTSMVARNHRVLFLATWLGVGPKTAMTSLYLLGVLQIFVFNRKWSFRFPGAMAPALIRYAVAYGTGYLVNFLALVAFVDHGGLPHQLVQALMILVVAVMLFLAQKYWVFPQSTRSDLA